MKGNSDTCIFIAVYLRAFWFLIQMFDEPEDLNVKRLHKRVKADRKTSIKLQVQNYNQNTKVTLELMNFSEHQSNNNWNLCLHVFC